MWLYVEPSPCPIYHHTVMYNLYTWSWPILLMFEGATKWSCVSLLPMYCNWIEDATGWGITFYFLLCYALKHWLHLMSIRLVDYQAACCYKQPTQLQSVVLGSICDRQAVQHLCTILVKSKFSQFAKGESLLNVICTGIDFLLQQMARRGLAFANRYSYFVSWCSLRGVTCARSKTGRENARTLLPSSEALCVKLERCWVFSEHPGWAKPLC